MKNSSFLIRHRGEVEESIKDNFQDSRTSKWIKLLKEEMQKPDWMEASRKISFRC